MQMLHSAPYYFYGGITTADDPKRLKNDVELTYYFYELPGLIWVRADGELFAS